MLVLGAALLCAALAISLIGMGVHYFSSSRGDPKEKEKMAALVELKIKAEDTVEFKSLEELHSRIQTYIYNNELSDLRQIIQDYLESQNVDLNKISWAVQDLTTDAYIQSDNAAQDFTAASTYKLPLVMLYCEMIANGQISPDDTLEFTENMKEQEDPENLYQPIHRKYAVGDKITIQELMESAIEYSDNIAGHMLFENLGGYTAFKLQAAKFSDDPQSKGFTSAQYNYLNANYMMDLMHYLYNTPDTFNKLKTWLLIGYEGLFLNDQLGRTYVEKTGNIDSVRNAVGYTYNEAPFSLVVYSDISIKEGEKILSDLGVLVLNYFQNKYYSGYYDNMDTSWQSRMNAQFGPEDDRINKPGLNGQTLREPTEEELKAYKDFIKKQNGEPVDETPAASTPSDGGASSSQSDGSQSSSPSDSNQQPAADNTDTTAQSQNQPAPASADANQQNQDPAEQAAPAQ